MRSRLTLLVALLLLALAVSGCGGGGEETTSATTTAPLSKAELIERGDRICAKVNRQIEEYEGELFEPSEEVDQAISFYTVMLGELAQLGSPQEADGYPEFMAAADDLETAGNAYDVEYETNRLKGLPPLRARTVSALAAFQDAAREYGFEDCSKGPSLPDLAV